ncbi:MAG: 2,3-bisphosphoglycerate-independent phosphoglycerate mutase, partial [Bacteroidota bacterium]
MHLLLILDGYGIAEDPSVSAVDAADTPFLDTLFETYPHSTLEASGLAVGLPNGQMGNSEVGHMNLGAGRVVYQDITRIDQAIEHGSFFDNNVLQDAVAHAKQNGTKLHLLGLFSDGGVHSTLSHATALLKMAATAGLNEDHVWLHAFTDGRDTDPNGGLGYLDTFQREAKAIGVGRVADLIGRYYAMDRDNRWERTQRAFDLLVHGKGEQAAGPREALEASYEAGVTDEFVEPVVFEDTAHARIEDGDAVVFFNFRTDRARQLCRALTSPSFEGFERDPLDLHMVTFTRYDEDFDYPVAFPKVNLSDTLGEVVARSGGTQLRAAETEKYPH